MPTYVTRPRLPDFDRLQGYLAQAYDSHQLTNNGPLLALLTQRLEELLGVKNLLLVSSGTMALQVALKLVGVARGEVVTTPFTFPATSSTIVWHGAKPVYADILPETLNVDPELLSLCITDQSEAVLVTHVFGNSVDVDRIEEICRTHNLPLIFDAAQSFGVKVSGSSVLNRGDISTLSFHATKLFHTLEGGALVVKDDRLFEEAQRMINFGLNSTGEVLSVGINGKMNEFEAAMGLAVLDEMDEITQGLSRVYAQYDAELNNQLVRPKYHPDGTRNCCYYPVLCSNSSVREEVQLALESHEIFPRRYFYPSLDTVKAYGGVENCLNSRDIVERILCLPIYASLESAQVSRICRLINACL